MLNEQIKQYADLMHGKRLLYVHGFGSSGQSGTVKRLRQLLPSAEIKAPDLPVRPADAMALLRSVCNEWHPHRIIGTSMGGMYAEMLYGYDRIVVNPAFEMGSTMTKHGMLGKNTFMNPREDGVQEFFITKPMAEEYREMTQRCFAHAEDDQQRVFGLFGDEDTTVDTKGLFSQHYCQAISFHGEHRLNDRSLTNAIIPVVRWIDDRQEGRTRPIVYISANALHDSQWRQRSSAVKAVRALTESYEVLFVADSGEGELMSRTQLWVDDMVNVPAWRRLIFTCRKDLLYGDYLVAPDAEDCGFTGACIAFGSDAFKTWEEVLEYFGRLGGQ